jgi:clan AA aspartic protease (TIGR02281 family)
MVRPPQVGWWFGKVAPMPMRIVAAVLVLALLGGCAQQGRQARVDAFCSMQGTSTDAITLCEQYYARNTIVEPPDLHGLPLPVASSSATQASAVPPVDRQREGQDCIRQSISKSISDARVVTGEKPPESNSLELAESALRKCFPSGSGPLIFAVAVARDLLDDHIRKDPALPASQTPKTTVSFKQLAGVFVVPVTINNAIRLNFTLDTGASDVSIPSDVVMSLMRTGTITDSDFLGKQTYVIADGSKVPSLMFRIRSLRVGDKMAEDVTASVAPSSGPLLLGQSFLKHFRSWSVDNERMILILD